MKYKIGDKVRVKSLEWYNENKNEFGNILCNETEYFLIYMSKFCGSILTIKNIKVDIDAYEVEENGYCWTDDMFEGLVKEETIQPVVFENIVFPNENYADKVELCLGNDYEIVVEGGRTFVQRKKPKYPKTYEECCGVLGITFDYPDIRMVSNKEYNLYSRFIELIRCRDAYWEIAGKQMGLGKSWEPDWDNLSTNHEFIKINKGCFTYSSRVLVFPTQEMRDAFYENFKDLIENCKELL